MLYETRNPHGGDIYSRPVRLDFSANTNPFGTPEGILQAISDHLGSIHRYPDPNCRELVEAVSDKEQSPASFILCGNGAAELVFSYCEALRAGTALELAPTFSEYSRAFVHSGGTMQRYALNQRNFLPGEDFFEVLEREHPDVLFFCNPNNPTGRLLPPEFLLRLLEATKKQGIRVFLDECFLDLTDEGTSMMEFLSDYPQLLILKAFTKSYGMAGVRLGCCFTADKGLLKAMSETVQPWNVSGLAQCAGVAALRETEFLERTRALIREERPKMMRNLEDLGIEVVESRTNFLLFHGPEGLDRRLLEDGIAIRSCANFQGLDAGWYRIAIRTGAENEELIRAMQAAMEDRKWQKIS